MYMQPSLGRKNSESKRAKPQYLGNEYCLWVVEDHLKIQDAPIVILNP